MAGIGSISVELNNLKSTSSRMQQVAEALTNANQALSNIMSDIDPIWEGSAKEKFKENSQKLQKKTKKLAEKVENRKRDLDESIAVYEKTEGTVMTQVNDLSADNIF